MGRQRGRNGRKKVGIRQKLNRNETERNGNRRETERQREKDGNMRNGVERYDVTFNVKITEEQRKTQIGTEMI